MEIGRKHEQENNKVYARPSGWHYHASRDCPMLAHGHFRLYGYCEITLEEAGRRALQPCKCVCEGGKK